MRELRNIQVRYALLDVHVRTGSLQTVKHGEILSEQYMTIGYIQAMLCNFSDLSFPNVLSDKLADMFSDLLWLRTRSSSYERQPRQSFECVLHLKLQLPHLSSLPTSSALPVTPRKRCFGLPNNYSLSYSSFKYLHTSSTKSRRTHIICKTNCVRNHYSIFTTWATPCALLVRKRH